MNVVMLNGSPRGRNANTQILLNQLLLGMQSVNIIEGTTYYLRETNHTDEHVAAVKAADLVLLGFPLYTDGMPGVTKHFIDALVPVDLQGKPMAFLVQSGFPEAAHSRPVERYLEKLSRRINATYCGTIVRGNSEGIRLRSASANRRVYEQFNALGASLAYDGRFKADLLEKVAGRETLPKLAKPLMNSGMMNFYWNYMLKKNNAYKERFAAPYAPAYGSEKTPIEPN